MAICIHNGKLLNGISDEGLCAVLINNSGKIDDVFSEQRFKKKTFSSDVKIIDAHKNFIAPGLIDTHIHGCMGADASDGDEAGLRRMAASLVESGVTGFLPTTMTVAWNALMAAFSTIRRLMPEFNIHPLAALAAGLLLYFADPTVLPLIVWPVVCHELGHIVVLRGLGCRITDLDLDNAGDADQSAEKEVFRGGRRGAEPVRDLMAETVAAKHIHSVLDRAAEKEIRRNGIGRADTLKQHVTARIYFRLLRREHTKLHFPCNDRLVLCDDAQPVRDLVRPGDPG